MTPITALLAVATMSLAHAQDSKKVSSDMIAEVQRSIFEQTNDFRKSRELPAVQRDDHLMQAAKQFAKFMAETGKYGTASFARILRIEPTAGK